MGGIRMDYTEAYIFVLTIIFILFIIVMVKSNDK